MSGRFDRDDWAAAYPNFVARSELYQRGWTRFLSKKYMPEPDRTAPNPHDPANGASAYLYRRARVAAIEATPEFQADSEEAMRRAHAERAKPRYRR